MSQSYIPTLGVRETETLFQSLTIQSRRLSIQKLQSEKTFSSFGRKSLENGAKIGELSGGTALEGISWLTFAYTALQNLGLGEGIRNLDHLAKNAFIERINNRS